MEKGQSIMKMEIKNLRESIYMEKKMERENYFMKMEKFNLKENF